jgi:ribosome recycling factor
MVLPATTNSSYTVATMTEFLNALLETAPSQFQAAIEHFDAELKTVRTGRANVAMLDSVRAVVYGSPMPLNQVATITTPEASQLLVTPFDSSNVTAIRTAITDANLGFNPSDDGRAVRIIIPALTTDRRKELVKQVNKLAEEARISVRGVRAKLRDDVEKGKKDGSVSEDQQSWAFDKIQKHVDDTNHKIDDLAKAKETDLLTV